MAADCVLGAVECGCPGHRAPALPAAADPQRSNGRPVTRSLRAGRAADGRATGRGSAGTRPSSTRSRCAPYSLAEARHEFPVEVDGGEDVEELRDEAGVVCGPDRAAPLSAAGRPSVMTAEPVGRLRPPGHRRAATRRTAPARDKDDAIRLSLIGAHVLLSAAGADFVSLLEPPDDAAAAVAGCRQRRCWPVMAGLPGSSRPRPRLADHPVRLPRGRRPERGRAVRLDRDRRDPHPAGDDADR